MNPPWWKEIGRHPVAAGFLGLAFLLLSTRMPLLMPLQFFLPLPFLLAGGRHELRRAVWALLPFGVGASLLDGNLLYPAIMSVMFAAVPLAFGISLRNGWPVTLGWSLLFAGGGVLLLGIILGSMLFGLDLQAALQASMEPVRDHLLADMQEKAQAEALLLAQTRAFLDQMIETLSWVFPSAFLSTWFLIQSGNLWMARNVLERTGQDVPKGEGLSDFRVPFFLVWAVIAFGVLAMVTQGSGRFLGVNMLLFLTMPYFFQGLAIIQSLFLRYTLHPFLRGLFYALLIVRLELNLILILLGLFDTWLDVRKYFNRADADPPGR
ncbi:MAG: DUF2232 domain-containing protein [Magnetococcales bacterium]|nr:DUF2232 domain-containing protein [Magnetococcales bacterium]